MEQTSLFSFLNESNDNGFQIDELSTKLSSLLLNQFEDNLENCSKLMVEEE